MNDRSSRTAAGAGDDQLDLLYRISQTLDSSLDLAEVVRPVLKMLVEGSELTSSALTLLNRDTREISIDEAYGLSARQRNKGKYRLGEGVTGRVVQNGQPVIVPRVSQAPEFLNRTGAASGPDDDASFVCVPIKLESAHIGALSAVRAVASDDALAADVRFLSVVGSMIAQAVRLRQFAQEAREELEAETTRLQDELRGRFRPDNIIGGSKPMMAVFGLIAQVAPSPTTVLILGESGTGKELVAEAIHYNSERADAPFVKINCGALPESVVESELFGHEKGAFTGAVAQRKGRFELADGGTLFLDEVGELTPGSQVKLLRVLQERKFERVGGTRTLGVDVRVIAATSRDLEEMVDAGTFRKDLYYRLQVFPILMPPLRERGSDIIALADHFVAKFNKRHQRQVRRTSTPAIDMMMAYHWPGNVRELENCIERAVLLSTDDVIHGHHLPPSLQTAEATGTVFHGTLEERLAALERELILDALKSSRGNMAQAARALGITERIMGLRVTRYGIEPKRFRTSA